MFPEPIGPSGSELLQQRCNRLFHEFRCRQARRKFVIEYRELRLCFRGPNDDLFRQKMSKSAGRKAGWTPVNSEHAWARRLEHAERAAKARAALREAIEVHRLRRTEYDFAIQDQ